MARQAFTSFWRRSVLGGRHHRTDQANFPRAFLFKVSPKIDSPSPSSISREREQFLGAAICYFIPPGTSKLTGIHGAYLSDAEISRIVEFIKCRPSRSTTPSIENLNWNPPNPAG